MKFIRIPMDVLADTRLNGTEKNLYGVVLTTDMQDGCRLSNSKLALLIGMKNGKYVSQMLSKLAQMGLITVEVSKGKRGMERVISAHEVSSNNMTPPPVITGDPHQQLQVTPPVITGDPYIDKKNIKNIVSSKKESSGRAETENLKDEPPLKRFQNEVKDLLELGTPLDSLTTNQQAVMVMGFFYAVVHPRRMVGKFVFDWVPKIEAKFSDYSAEDLIHAIWNVKHCAFYNQKRGWCWSLPYLLEGSKMAKTDPLQKILSVGIEFDVRETPEELALVTPYEKLLTSPLSRYGGQQANPTSAEGQSESRRKADEAF